MTAPRTRTRPRAREHRDRALRERLHQVPGVDLRLDPAVYRSMPRESLIYLRFAFELDRDAATDPRTRAFCQSRLTAIDEILG